MTPVHTSMTLRLIKQLYNSAEKNALCILFVDTDFLERVLYIWPQMCLMFMHSGFGLFGLSLWTWTWSSTWPSAEDFYDSYCTSIDCFFWLTLASNTWTSSHPILYLFNLQPQSSSPLLYSLPPQLLSLHSMPTQVSPQRCLHPRGNRPGLVTQHGDDGLTAHLLERLRPSGKQAQSCFKYGGEKENMFYLLTRTNGKSRQECGLFHGRH